MAGEYPFNTHQEPMKKKKPPITQITQISLVFLSCLFVYFVDHSLILKNFIASSVKITVKPSSTIKFTKISANPLLKKITW